MLRFIFTLSFVCLSCAVVSFAETRACAHRGDAAVAPENTLPAIQSAVEKGAHMIEFDVGATKDGHLVILHDNTVDRTTNGKGKLVDLTFDEVRALDAGAWFDEKFAGTQVPTLRETLEIIPHEIWCNVHLKSGAGIAEKSALVIQEMGRLDHCFLAASKEQTEEARAAVPDIKICDMSQRLGDRQKYIAGAIVLKADFIQLFYGNGMLNLKDDVTQLHQNGLQVNWFGASQEEPIRQLADAGIDFILTDDLDLCLNILKDYGVKPIKTAKE